MSSIRQWCSTEYLGHLIERLEISLTIGSTTSASFHSQTSGGAGAVKPCSKLQECRSTETRLLSPFDNHPKVKISMLSMWNPLKPNSSKIGTNKHRSKQTKYFL